MRRLSYFRQISGHPAGSPIVLAPAHHPFRRAEGRAPVEPPKPVQAPATASRKSSRAGGAHPPAAATVSKSRETAAGPSPFRPESSTAEPLARLPEQPAFHPPTIENPYRSSQDSPNIPMVPPPAERPRGEAARGEMRNPARTTETHTVAAHEPETQAIPRVPNATAPRSTIEIGSIEIEIVERPAAAPAAKPTASTRPQSSANRRPAPAPLARDFASTVGLRQG